MNIYQVLSGTGPNAADATHPRAESNKHAELTERFLRDHVSSVNLEALRCGTAGTVVAPLSVDSSTELGLGEKVMAEVVVFNRKAAHTLREIFRRVLNSSLTTPLDA